MTKKSEIIGKILIIIVCIIIVVSVFYVVVTHPSYQPPPEQYPGVITNKWIAQRNGYDYYFFAISDYYLMAVNYIKYNQYDIGDNIYFTMEQVQELE